MTDPRIRTIRFWTLTAACLLLTLLYPDLAIYLFAGWAWCPLGLFMPVFPSEDPFCSLCEDAPTEIHLTLELLGDYGFPFGACTQEDCDSYFGTNVLSRAGSCCWAKSVALACSGNAGDYFAAHRLSGFWDIILGQSMSGCTCISNCDTLSEAATTSDCQAEVSGTLVGERWGAACYPFSGERTANLTAVMVE